jgi:hypothetical protein
MFMEQGLARAEIPDNEDLVANTGQNVAVPFRLHQRHWALHRPIANRTVGALELARGGQINCRVNGTVRNVG